MIDEHFGPRGKFLGTEATEVLRATGVEAFIIGLTSDVQLVGHVKKALAAGQDHVLGKPFTDSAKLRLILQRLVFEKKARLKQQQQQQHGRWGSSSSCCLTDASEPTE